MSTAVRKDVRDRLAQIHGAFPLEGAELASVGNHGLFLERYLPDAESGGEKQQLVSHLDALGQISVPAVYRRALEERRAMFERQQLSGHTVTREMEVDEQMIIGLGGASVRETGFSLLSIYGLPYIPGSALKGLSRRFIASDQIIWPGGNPDQEQIDVLFGYQRTDPETGEVVSAAAKIAFHDAWFAPAGESDAGPFLREAMTPHHPNYNMSAGKEQASDLDDPTPVQYLTATGRYLVAITGPDQAWAEHAMELVVGALTASGVGAKTSSGYGRLSIYTPPAPPPEHRVIRQLREVPLEQICQQYGAYEALALRLGLDHGEDVANRYLEVLQERYAECEELGAIEDEPLAEVGPVARELIAEVRELTNPHGLRVIAQRLDELSAAERRHLLEMIRDYVAGLSGNRLRNLQRQAWFPPLRSELDGLE